MPAKRPRRPARGLRLGAMMLSFGLALASPAAALTPEAMLGQWQEVLQDAGFTVTTRLRQDGDTVILDRMALTLPGADGANTLAVELRGIELHQLAGGLVSVELPAETPFSVDLDRGDKPWRAEGRLLQDQFVMRSHSVSGSDEILSDFTAAALNLTIDSLIAGGKTQPGAIRLVAEAPEGQVALLPEADSPARLTHNAQATSLSFDMTHAAPARGQDIVVSGKLEGIATDGSTRPGPGSERDAHLTWDSGQMQTTLDGTRSGNLSTASGGGALDLRSGDGQTSFLATSRAVAFALSSDALTAPLNGRVDEARLASTGPTVMTGAEAPFSFDLRLADVTPPAMAWPLIDPAGRLPRDPLSLALSATGTKQALAVSDDVAIASLPLTGAGQTSALRIEAFNLTGAGAALSGQGTLQLDPGNPSRFGPVPRAEGSIDLRGEGLLALLNALGDSGLVPPALVMALPLYLPLLAEQEGSRDVLSTRLRLGLDESLSVNGSPLIPGR
ncbi:translocation/assembly module TamB domain-containing protein [Pseudooceanicola algae]|uniref:DUF2125 domain-containing protein n=1 Tax=Pseudooceanicola algae TaxID=1537215 RepID=A0A418SFZ5_9RHOB|nr:hypothetical protein [Pseudooceanicola algae]QPM91593.1 hypothetical protein PSAL_028480 [Pseudooceanicola algae]